MGGWPSGGQGKGLTEVMRDEVSTGEHRYVLNVKRPTGNKDLEYNSGL